MKKIYFISLFISVLILGSCKDFNESNFPGFDEAAKPTNVVSYTDTLTDADYVTISKIALAAATNSSDTTKATVISTKKYFPSSAATGSLIGAFLKTKYLYADAGSMAAVTYNYDAAYDTTTIATANKYTLVATDYDAMGTATNQPGKYDNFSSSIDPNQYIPVWLKMVKNPYAKAGTVMLIRYKYYSTSTIQLADVFVYDGTNWIKYKTTNAVTKTFVYKNGAWKDIVIYSGLTTGIKDFTTYSVSGTQVWGWDNSYLCMKMSGYSGGNLDNQDWLISPKIDLTTRSAATLTFSHAGKYFGTLADETTLWVSKNYVSGDPTATSVTWTQITIPTNVTNTDYTFVSSGKVDLKAYIGSSVSIAFKYKSTTSAAGTWEINNVSIVEE
ncbi:MAG: hypothetical protein H6Q17_114 [Bacteroidetes bacterium]|nr:hypothetical protein [Bacteroidota bacterium]